MRDGRHGQESGSGEAYARASGAPAAPTPTEAVNPRTADLGRAGSREIVRLLQAEDRLVPAGVEAEAERIAALIDDVAGRLAEGGRLVYVGAGTSGRLGVLDAAECPPTFGTDPNVVVGLMAGGAAALRRSVEGAEDDEDAGRADVRTARVGPADFVLGIATSGSTPYVRAAIEEASALGAGTGFLSCAPPPDEVRRIADHLVTPLVGPEAIAGSTRMKAGTATKLVLNTLSTGVMIRLGKVYGNLMVDLRAGSRKLVRRALGILEATCGVTGSEARELLVRAGGSVKTAIAMRELGVERAVAERLLDACNGHLALCVERFAGREPLPTYGCYSEELAPGDARSLLRRLRSGPERVRSACAVREAAVGPGRPTGRWSPAQHIAHLAQAEREAYRPRIEALVRSVLDDPVAPPLEFADWPPASEPPGGGRSVPEALLVFAAERARSVELLDDAPDSAWLAHGSVAGEPFRLHQLVRAMVQHDLGHAARIRERVHPDLLA